MKKTFLGAVGLCCLIACQQNEEVGNEEMSAPVRLEAEVRTEAGSRTMTQQSGKVSFEDQDQIGFYMPGEELSGVWTYNGENWTSFKPYEWKDKVNEYTFCAYYPYGESVSRTQIPMPDLTTQKGEWKELGNYDFLTARCTTNYSQKNGVVSFTGKEAFKHEYALISVTLKKDKEEENVVISDMAFEAEGLMTSSTFHFGVSAAEDGVTMAKEAVNSFAFQGMSAAVPLEGYNKVLVINPLVLNSPLNLSIKYTRDQIRYTASTPALGKEFKKGCFYSLKLRLKKSGLVVEGNTVEDWNIIPMEDVNVEEIPAE